MDAAVVVDIQGGFVPNVVLESVRFAVPLAESEFGGLAAGIWFCAGRPIRIPLPEPAGLDAWVDDWLDRGSPTARLRGVKRDNGLQRLKESGKIRSGQPFRLSPTLESVLDASANLRDHTVVFVVLTEEPEDGAEFMATMKRAARYPVFWVFIGAEASVERSARLGVVDTLGREPGDPENFVIVKVNGWPAVTRWSVSRKVRRAVRRWRSRTPLG
ncbi:hypothetical protein OHT77_26685 [Streptomyces sp. NBC_00252]|uniref:hypothetical protein n=1 Tax=Streptomyces sp. NBC_00252 TaxID=2975691 RepID=UPI002E28B98A|nr:hypothetical protein [Streptomyces sp. NBC_00252]